MDARGVSKSACRKGSVVIIGGSIDIGYGILEGFSGGQNGYKIHEYE